VDHELPVLDAVEVTEDIDVLALFDYVPDPAAAVAVVEAPREKLRLRRHPRWVSRATTERRANIVCRPCAAARMRKRKR